MFEVYASAQQYHTRVSVLANSQSTDQHCSHSPAMHLLITIIHLNAPLQRILTKTKSRYFTTEFWPEPQLLTSTWSSENKMWPSEWNVDSDERICLFNTSIYTQTRTRYHTNRLLQWTLHCMQLSDITQHPSITSWNSHWTTRLDVCSLLSYLVIHTHTHTHTHTHR